MKKWLIGLTIVALVVSCTLSIYAAPGRFGRNDDRRDGRHNDGPRRQHERYEHVQEDARYIINRTTSVLFEAQRAVIRGHRSMGLAHAFAAQSKARELYIQRQYREAIFHSLRARDLAFRIIRDNRRRVKPEFFPDRIEEFYAHDRPGDEELDRHHDRRNFRSDDDAVHFNIEFNIN